MQTGEQLKAALAQQIVAQSAVVEEKKNDVNAGINQLKEQIAAGGVVTQSQLSALEEKVKEIYPILAPK